MTTSTADMTSFGTEESHCEEAKTYASVEYAENYKIRPLLTLYTPVAPVVSIKAPLSETSEETQEYLRVLSYASALFIPGYARIIIDGFADLTNGDVCDAVYIVRFNKRIADANTLPYEVPDGTTAINWLDPKILTEEDHFAKNATLYNFSANMTFNTAVSVGWRAYLGWLQTKAFEIIYHPGYDETVFGFFAREIV